MQNDMLLKSGLGVTRPESLCWSVHCWPVQTWRNLFAGIVWVYLHSLLHN